ncbi:hypothetical protein A9Q81_11740 [Gammaproteobacteria bacterium 42_54_T18]|nr:hypothetical protein A9Q81_11740 [Gammaproteobacteria bacterium 42_54_T18]
MTTTIDVVAGAEVPSTSKQGVNGVTGLTVGYGVRDEVESGIMDRFERELSKCVDRTGSIPSTMYVGRYEHRQLRDCARDYWRFPVGVSDLEVFCGINIIRVMMDNHLVAM